MHFDFLVFGSKTRPFPWFCLSFHIQFGHKPWIVCLSLHVWKCWDIISRTLVRDYSATRNNALRSWLNRRRLKRRSRLVLYVRRRAVRESWGILVFPPRPYRVTTLTIGDNEYSICLTRSLFFNHFRVFIWFKNVYKGVTSTRGVENIKIERHTVIRCQTPQMSRGVPQHLRQIHQRQWPCQLKSCCSWIPWPSPTEKLQFRSHPRLCLLRRTEFRVIELWPNTRVVKCK